MLDNSRLGLSSMVMLAVVGWILLSMVREHNARRHPLLSARNLFLLGFCLFQFGSVLIWQYDELIYHIWTVHDPYGLVVWEFVGQCLLFLVIFEFCYHRGHVSRLVVRPLALPEGMPPYPIVIALTMTLGILGSAMSLASMMGSAAGYLISILGRGIAIGACALAAAAWGRRSSIGRAIGFAIVFGIVLSVEVVTTGHRRGLVSISLAALTGVFYARFMHQRAERSIGWLAAGSIPMVLIIALFTSVRHSAQREGGFVQHVNLMLEQGSLSRGLGAIAGLQDSGPASLWLLENRGEYAQRPLHSLRFFFLYFVPRSLWEDKPTSLGILLPRIAGMNVGGNLGPGMIGHASAEGGLLALIIYAVWMGLFMRALDEILFTAIRHPLAIMIACASLGEVLAMSRGELAFFADLAFVATVGAMIAAELAGRVLRPLFRPSR